MLVLICGAVWVGLVICLLCRAIRQYGNYQEATISGDGRSVMRPSVSIIVPVRNEIANVELCLEGLTAQSGLSSQSTIIVVDDGSEDGTRAAVERHITADAAIRLIDAGPLPTGWTGKPHACWRGAVAAQGDWLCFVDADVRVAPELIVIAVKTAETGGIDMLSLHPRQELGGFWERLIFPPGLMVLACAKRFEPTLHHVVNGQFLLVRRDAYFAVGGHSEVRAEICEDKALASRLLARGFNLQVLAAPHLAHTRMYRDLQSLWEGFSKNSADVLGNVRATLIAATATLVFGWTAVLLPLANLPIIIAEPSRITAIGGVLSVLGTAIVIGVHFGAARHLRIPAIFGLTFPIGYTLVACLAWHGVIIQLTGRVAWKGRTYQLTKTSARRA
ncbi:MAG: glycosyltransferase [Alphaproteobacteria bacterium]|nr:glycosyltransferase [Alphaproteobacteria bacterium]